MQPHGKITRWQLSTANLSDNVLRYIEDAIAANNFGTVTLVVQDGVLVQIEVREIIRVDNAEDCPPTGQKSGPATRSKLFQTLLGLQFGQVVVTVNNGTIARIERNERTRWRGLEGLDGEGI